MVLPFLILVLSFLHGFSSIPMVAGEGNEEHPHIDLRFEHHDIAHHIRAEDGNYGIERAVIRRVEEHLQAEETAEELHNQTLEGKALRTRATLFYYPDLDDICREQQKWRAHPTATRNVCVSPRAFSVDCDRDDTETYVDTIHGYCKPDWFCVTVLRDSLNIVDPDNLHLGQAATPVCTKTYKFNTYRINQSIVEFVSDWWTAPGEFKVFLGRMAVLGDTSGVSYKLKWKMRQLRSIFIDTIGIKSIENENSGNDHEYELSYNFQHSGRLLQFAAVTYGLDAVASSKKLWLNVYWGDNQ